MSSHMPKLRGDDEQEVVKDEDEGEDEEKENDGHESGDEGEKVVDLDGGSGNSEDSEAACCGANGTLRKGALSAFMKTTSSEEGAAFFCSITFLFLFLNFSLKLVKLSSTPNCPSLILFSILFSFKKLFLAFFITSIFILFLVGLLYFSLIFFLRSTKSGRVCTEFISWVVLF